VDTIEVPVQSESGRKLQGLCEDVLSVLPALQQREPKNMKLAWIAIEQWCD